MIETKADYEENLQKVKDLINADIEKKGSCILDKKSISWEQLVDLATDYKFKYPSNTDNLINFTRVEK